MVDYGRGVVSTRTFFTERIQQDYIENTRVLKIECRDEDLGNATSCYWVLVNDSDIMADVGFEWVCILWGEIITKTMIVGVPPLFLLDGKVLEWLDPVRDIPPWSVLSWCNPIEL
jgi:hypothetical protein